eukprot:gene2616-2656_t
MSPVPDASFTPLLVRRAEPAADGIQLFELVRDDGGPLPAFSAGAHLQLKLPNGLIRRYSLANDPIDTSFYQFAVKREDPGTGGSRALIDGTKAGDHLEVSAPQNDFALAPAAPGYILIAGGIGITPMMSMARHLLSTLGKPFKLYYFARTPAQMAFRDELSGPDFKGRVITHCDQGDPAKSYDLWPVLEKFKSHHLYCCGPRGLMEAVRDMTGHWPTSAVHFEDFGQRQAPRPTDTPFAVRLARTGTTHMIPADRSILETLRDAGVAVPCSCEAGSCGTCEVGLLEGTADHRDLVLAEHEKSRRIMVCVSRAITSELVLDL